MTNRFWSVQTRRTRRLPVDGDHGTCRNYLISCKIHLRDDKIEVNDVAERNRGQQRQQESGKALHLQLPAKQAQYNKAELNPLRLKHVLAERVHKTQNIDRRLARAFHRNEDRDR